MKICVIGGGPAGLFFAYLMGRADAGHDIHVYERDPEGATYGWGLVFSDVALSFVREIAPELYESMADKQVVFDAMAIVQFERRCDDIAEFSDCDLIVAADGANSAIRTRYRQQFEPTLDERPNLLAWYGTTRLFEPLSLIFRQNQDGLMVGHCYQFSRTHSTFLVETPPDTFHRAGLDRMSEAESLAYCEASFAEDLDGHPLLSNRSLWFRYTIVRNNNWHFDNVVLLGDALRTGHPSIGSGTRMALQDSIALYDAYRISGGNVPRLLEEFCRLRRPGSDLLQQAAIKSTEWYENLGPKLDLDPVSFAYDYMRRSGRVSHADIQTRDPELASAYEKLHPAEEPLRGHA